MVRVNGLEHSTVAEDVILVENTKPIIAMLRSMGGKDIIQSKDIRSKDLEGLHLIVTQINVMLRDRFDKDLTIKHVTSLAEMTEKFSKRSFFQRSTLLEAIGVLCGVVLAIAGVALGAVTLGASGAATIVGLMGIGGIADITYKYHKSEKELAKSFSEFRDKLVTLKQDTDVESSEKEEDNSMKPLK